MNCLRTSSQATLLAAAIVLSATTLVAQEATKPALVQAASPSRDAQPELTVTKIETELAAIEANSGIEDAVKDLLRSKYKQAIEALSQAEANLAKASEFRSTIQTAPTTSTQLREQLKSLPSAENAAQATTSGTAEDLQKDLDSRQAALEALNEELSKITAELTRVKGRPVEVSDRLPEAQRELAEIIEQLARPELAEDPASPGRTADRILLEAQQRRLLGELDMLKQEQASLSLREDLLRAQQDLLQRQVENATAAVKALQARVRGRLETEAQRLGTLASEIWEEIPKEDQAAQTLAAEVRALAKELEQVVKQLKLVSAAQEEVKTQHDRLTFDYDDVSQQLKLGGAGTAMAQHLFDMQRQLESGGHYSLTMAAPETTPGELRLAAYRVDKELRLQPEVEGRFADHSSDAVAQIVAGRRDILDQLSTQYGNLIRATAAVEGERRQYLDKCSEVRKWIPRQLVWLRSSPPVSLATITDLPSGLRWEFSLKHGREFVGGLQSVAARMPGIGTAVLLVLVLLLLSRPAVVQALDRTGAEVRRISTDRYAHTAKALFWTALLAVPIPLLLGFGGWALGKMPQPSGWMRGVATGLWIAAWIAYATGFLRAVCRPGGLGEAHFKWLQEPLARFRRLLLWFASVYIPAFVLICSTVYGEASQFFESLGRVSFIAVHLWTSFIIWSMLSSSDGIFSTLVRNHPHRFIVRIRHAWYALAILWPLALVVLASLGYLVTSIEVSLWLLSTTAIVSAGVMLYWLSLRWFLIKQRKLALAEALERRRERQEAAVADAEPDEAGEVVSVEPEDDEGRDLESIGEQTRHLLRLVFALAVAVAIFLFWSRTIPLITILDEITVPLTAGRTLLTFLKAALIVLVTYVAVQDLPGLLELALRTRTTRAGTRHAISTLCQYTLVAIGIVLLLNVLAVDWASFGWIAAGLSVGLGFGLQEVVANLVCGLILLFECPIRLGDVVTVEGTTGTVTKIRMRATTITNWDRQEFVVPNKNLITGTILNWTLTASINRIIVSVGVAYGSDTERAQRILLDIAADHPEVVDDPAPMATFEEFADSSLTLRLLVYVPDVDNRRRTISELHGEIDKRFGAAGIEIAFPQRDLHLRSADATLGIIDSNRIATTTKQ